jgi:sialidase-1
MFLNDEARVMAHRWLSLASILAVVICGFARQATAVDYARTIPQDPTGGGYQAWPDVARLQDGRLMCVFYNGNGHGSSPAAVGRIDYSISTNEGYTWSTPRVLYDGPMDDHDSSITQMKNGQVIVSFFIDSGRDNSPYGYSSGVMTMTSDDGCKNWTVPRQITASTDYYCSSPTRELSNGRLVLGVYKQTPTAANGAVLISNNHGTTWSSPIDIPLPPPGEQQWLPAETDVIQLKDSHGNFTSNLYAVQRTNFDSAYFSTSADFGSTWTQSQAIGFNAHCPYLHRAPNGAILLAYRDYSNSTYGHAVTALRYSTDECQTWSDEVLVDSVYGGAYPSIVDRLDGTELIAYYQEGGNSNVLVRRFSVTQNGIEWLPVVPMHAPEPGTTSLFVTAGISLLAYVWRRRRPA